MTDEPTPTGDFFEQIAAKAEELGPTLLKQLEESVENKGKVVRFICSKCGQRNEQTVETMDIEEKRKTLEMLASIQLRSSAQRKDDNTSKRARDILRDIEDMTDVQIAEAIATLEADGGSPTA